MSRIQNLCNGQLDYIIFPADTITSNREGLEPEYRSPHSDWLQAEQLRDRSSSSDRGEISLFSTLSRHVMEPIQLPVRWVLKSFPRR
jgi:hypothetical protein